MTQRKARGVAVAWLALAAMVGCSSDPDVGLATGRKKVMDDAGPPEVDACVPQEDGGQQPPTDAGTPPECTFTPGYWKNHPRAWPETSLTIGGVTYDQSELLALLSAPTRGDASITLARHLIAAILNGGRSDATISDTIDDAEDWLAAHCSGGMPCGLAPGSAASTYVTGLASRLAMYNEGTIGPGHCD